MMMIMIMTWKIWLLCVFNNKRNSSSSTTVLQLLATTTTTKFFFCFCCYHLHAPNFKRILHFLGLVKKIPWSFHNKHLFFVESSLLCWIELNGNELNESYICRSNESHLWSFCFLFFLRCYEWEWMNGAMWQCRALVFSFSKKPKYKLLINDDADAVVDLHTRKKVTAIIDMYPICTQK